MSNSARVAAWTLTWALLTGMFLGTVINGGPALAVGLAVGALLAFIFAVALGSKR